MAMKMKMMAMVKAIIWVFYDNRSFVIVDTTKYHTLDGFRSAKDNGHKNDQVSSPVWNLSNIDKKYLLSRVDMCHLY